MKDIDKFAKWTHSTWVSHNNPGQLAIMSLGLAGETGEALEHIKKLMRDNKWDENAFKKEMGDVIHYWAKICDYFDYKPSEILAMNVAKIEDRKKRQVLNGKGDER